MIFGQVFGVVNLGDDEGLPIMIPAKWNLICPDTTIWNIEEPADAGSELVEC